MNNLARKRQVGKMKVLQVNCVYGKGSTGKITADIHRELLERGIESVVCYGRGARPEGERIYKTCGELYSKMNNLLSRFTGIMYGGCLISTHRLMSIIQKEKPDIVHLHCINGYFVNIYRIVSWLKEKGIRTVLTLHAEFMYTANCGHALDCDGWKNGCGNCPRWKWETKSLLFDRTAASWKRMKRAFDGFENLTVVSVSPWLMERAKQSPILGDKRHTVVLNGLDTDIFHPYDANDLKEKHGITDEKVIFHVTPSFTRDPNHLKGGYYVLNLAEMMKSERVKFIVAGKYEADMKVPDNVILLGQVADQRELARYYSMADVTVLTSKRETFSMVAAESLSCGTPVVGFKAGGLETISVKEHSYFAEYADMNDLTLGIHRMLEAGKVELLIKDYSREKMTCDYLNIYERLIRRIN